LATVTDPGVLDLPLPDEPARSRIERDLDTNLLVEAGAGSGKTTALVARMVALVSTGKAEVDQIAAVTFTRKAAAELGQRFQMKLEEVLRAERADPRGDAMVVERLARALEAVDRAFVGTIHSFCARLLRERPLEVGLDPAFEELPVEERVGLRRVFWDSYLERLTRDADPILEDLSRAGIRPALLEGAFAHLVENPDVRFPLEDAEPPGRAELGGVRAELEAIVDHGWELMPEREPAKRWDPLQSKLRMLHFTRSVTGWREPAELFEAIGMLCKRGPRGHSITQNRWREAAMAVQLRDRADAFGVGDTPAQRLRERWFAHRYALVIRLVRAAAEEFAAYRLRIGRLDFQDLLVLTARLLRSDPGVRRALGRRYRYLLVDEFQDTDPLQAEIVLLLASEPPEDAPGPDGTRAPAASGETDWRTATPRAGALFVVGDPKQSIYRFRRADIQLYGMVKERFVQFGEVLELTTNFRSRPSVGDIVNELFPTEGFLPALATAEQAAFEPLNTRPPTRPTVAEGVFTYEIRPSAKNRSAAAVDDAARLATWIRDRVDAGERGPGDFLVLTRYRSQLATYARALEERGVPVQVTGAGVGAEQEIRELQVILECMIDPANPVKVVSALVGLFFGLDYEQLLTHRLAGGGFDVVRPGDEGHPEVLAALRALREWWRSSTAEPADIVISRLVAELGLLPYAAAGDLGALRAGALLYALDAVRASALAGDASLPGALRALQSALALPEAEAPLEPGRPDVVRLMNLHQAKGLEARVVVLAEPCGASDRAPDTHTERHTDGGAVGYLRIVEQRSGWGGDVELAVPLGWDAKQDAARRFDEAEEVRLLYVAATRAYDELVVARWPDAGGRNKSPWAALEPWLAERATLLELEARDAEPRVTLDLTPGQAAEGSRLAALRVAGMAVPTYEHVTVTELAKATEGERADARVRTREPAPGAYRGLSWGSAVHGALAAAASEGSTSEGLRATCRDLLVAQGRPLDDHGEPLELGELIELVGTVRGSDLWRRAQAAERHLVEVSFARPGLSAPEPRVERPPDGPPGARHQLDLFPAADGDPRRNVARQEDDGIRSHPRVLEGVIDLVFREPDGWVIADYKTDVGTDPDFEGRSASYRLQVELYADAWSALTGEPIKERVLFFTAQGRIERW
jgi:ATP-dependent helicase/nuclease subunit A